MDSLGNSLNPTFDGLWWSYVRDVCTHLREQTQPDTESGYAWLCVRCGSQQGVICNNCSTADYMVPRSQVGEGLVQALQDRLDRLTRVILAELPPSA